MPGPPTWLVEWVRLVLVIATTIAAIRGLIKGGMFTITLNK